MTADWVFAGRGATTNGYRRWRVDGGALVEGTSFDSGGTVNGLELSPENKWLIIAQNGSPHITVRSFDRETGELGAAINAANPPDSTEIYRAAWLSEDRVVISHRDNGSGDYAGNHLSLFRFDGGDLTLLDSIALAEPPRSWAKLGVSADGRWVVVPYGTLNARFASVEVVDDALVTRDSIEVGSPRAQGAIIFATDIGPVKRVLLYYVTASSSFLVLVHLDDEGNFTEVATSPANGEFGTWQHSLSPDQQYAINPGGGTAGTVNEATGDLAELDHIFDGQTRAAEWLDGSRKFVVADADTIYLFEFDGESVSQLDSEEWDSTIRALTTTRTLVNQPLTPEEEFAATYADASGRDPFPSAVITRTDARSLANTNVNFYRWHPRLVSRPAHILLGEHSLTRPGGLIWHYDPEDPPFKRGRWALTLGRDGDARPGVRQILMVIADNPDSFVPPEGWTPE